MAKKIIVVDDEQNNRIALFESLSRRGYNVSVAENGAIALDIIKRNSPDLVITDIGMPEMDGLELLQQLRSMGDNLPVLIFTGHATVDTAVRAMKLGALDYMLKPVAPEVINGVVDRVFQEAEREKQPVVGAVIRRRKSKARGKTLIGRMVIWAGLCGKREAWPQAGPRFCSWARPAPARRFLPVLFMVKVIAAGIPLLP